MSGRDPSEIRCSRFELPVPTEATRRLGASPFRHGGPVVFSAMLDDERLVVAGGDSVRLLDLVTGIPTRAFRLSGEVRQAALAPDAGALALLLEQKTFVNHDPRLELVGPHFLATSRIAVLDLESGQLRALELPARAETRLAISPDAAVLAICTGAEVTTVRLASGAELGKGTASLLGLDGMAVDAARGRVAAVFGGNPNPSAELNDRTPWVTHLFLWRVDGTTIVDRQQDHQPLRGLAFSDDGAILVGLDGDGRTVVAWDADTGRDVASESLVPIRAAPRAQLRPSRDTALAVGPGAEPLVTTHRIVTASGQVAMLEASHTTTSVAVRSRDQSIVRGEWNQLRTFTGDGTPVGAALALPAATVGALSGDGERYLYRTGAAVIVADTHTLNPVVTIALEDVPFALALDQHGELAAAATPGGELVAWHPPEAHLTTVHPAMHLLRELTCAADSVAAIAWPDRRDASAEIVLWRVGDDHICEPLRPPAAPLSLALSADGALLAAGAADWCVYVWDRATASLKAALPGHAAAVVAVAFAPDTHTLCSLARDGELLTWTL